MIPLARIAAFGLASLLVAGPLSALPRVVEATIDDAPHPARAQLRAELAAAGFDVVIEKVEQFDESSLERAAIETHSAAAVAVGASQPPEAIVWLTDRQTRRGQIHRVAATPGDEEPERLLALRVVELLYASSLEIAEAASSAPEAPDGAKENEVEEEAVQPDAALETPKEPAVAAPSPPSPPPPARDAPAQLGKDGGAGDGARFAAALGATMLAGAGGFAPAVAPSLMLSARPGAAWALEALAVAPAFSSVSDDDGSASTDYESLAVRLRVEPLGASRWSPFASAGVGGFHLGARGSASPPFEARSAHAFGVLIVAAAGLRARIAGDLGVVAEAGAGWMTPRPVVRVAGEPAARSWRPLVAATLALELGWGR